MGFTCPVISFESNLNQILGAIIRYFHGRTEATSFCLNSDGMTSMKFILLNTPAHWEYQNWIPVVVSGVKKFIEI